jgi:hypothetical protein
MFIDIFYKEVAKKLQKTIKEMKKKYFLPRFEPVPSKRSS